MHHIVFIVPDIKVFPWSMREAWQVLFQKAKIPFRWILHREGKAEMAIRKLGPHDVVILLNDHHLSDLTKYLMQKGIYGRGRDERIWLGIATEKVIGSPFPESELKTRDCARLSHVVAHFDSRAGELIQAEGAVSFFCHQYASTDLFIPRKAWANKKNGVFWSGKLSVGDHQGAYRLRRSLFDEIQNLPGFHWRDAAQENRNLAFAVSEKDMYKSLINLPSNCPGYTANFFENLAMGGCCFQHRMDFPMPMGLVEEETHLGYDAENPETLRECCERFLREPDMFRAMAERGQAVCRRHHSLRQRAGEIFAVLPNTMEDRDFKHPAIELLHRVVSQLIVDL